MLGPTGEQTWKTVKRVEQAHEDGIWTVAWSSQNKILSGGVDEIVAVRDASSKDLMLTHQFAGHELGVVSIAVDKTGSTAVASSIDSVIRFWDLETGAQKPEKIEAGAIECWTVALSPDGQLLASGTSNATVNVWSTRTLEKACVLRCACREITDTSETPQSSMQSKDTKNFVFDVNFSHDGASLAASCLDGWVSVFDVATRQRIAVLEGHFMPVRCVRFSAPDSSSSRGTVLTACDDCRILQFDPFRQSGATCVDEYTAHLSWVLGVAPAPDGRHFASCSADRTVKIWDMAATKSVSASLDHGHADQIWACAYSPDGASLVSVADDATMQRHDLVHPGAASKDKDKAEPASSSSSSSKDDDDDDAAAGEEKPPHKDDDDPFHMTRREAERCWQNALDPNFGRKSSNKAASSNARPQARRFRPTTTTTTSATAHREDAPPARSDGETTAEEEKQPPAAGATEEDAGGPPGPDAATDVSPAPMDVDETHDEGREASGPGLTD